MNKCLFGKSKENFKLVAAAVLAVGLAMVPVAFAGSHSKITSAKSVGIVSHLAITSSSSPRLRIVKQHKRRYLAIADSDAANLVVVDVTKPGQARVVDPAAATGANPVADVTKSAADAPEILTLLNTSKPTESLISHQFTSSARFLADEKRGLIYVVDGEGLWIVMTQRPESNTGDSNTDYSAG